MIVSVSTSSCLRTRNFQTQQESQLHWMKYFLTGKRKWNRKTGVKSENSSEIVVQNKRSSESNQKLVSWIDSCPVAWISLSYITIFAGDSFNGRSYSEYHIIRGGLHFNFSVSVFFSVFSVYTLLVPVTLDYKRLLPKFSVSFFHFLSFYFSPGNYSSLFLTFAWLFHLLFFILLSIPWRRRRKTNVWEDTINTLIDDTKGCSILLYLPHKALQLFYVLLYSLFCSLEFPFFLVFSFPVKGF